MSLNDNVDEAGELERSQCHTAQFFVGNVVDDLVVQIGEDGLCETLSVKPAGDGAHLRIEDGDEFAEGTIVPRNQSQFGRLSRPVDFTRFYPLASNVHLWVHHFNGRHRVMKRKPNLENKGFIRNCKK